MIKKTILLLLFSAAALMAQNVRVTDYKVPVSRATTLRANGFWNWSQTGDSVTGNTATADFIFRKFYSSLPFAWFINVDGTGGRTAGQENYDVKFDASIRKYIWENEDWFGFSRITAEKANGWRRTASDLTLGVGYGRYINATALAKAVRIEEHFLKENVITGHLPGPIMINIANIIERENEYINLYGRDVYETQWFSDIEKEVQASGMLKGSNIGSIGILRMRQVLFSINEKVNERYYGWDISVGALFTLTTRDPDLYPSGSRNFTVSGRYSFPFSWATQLNLTADIFTPIDTAFAKRVSANTGVDFIYELSNRINFVTGYRFGLLKEMNSTAQVYNLINASFLFYIENNIYFGISGSYQKETNSPKRLSTSVTLSYNLI